MNWINYSPNLIEIPVVNVSNRDSLELATESVRYIVSEYPPPYTIFASGGIDSQSTILSWIASGEKFQVYTVRYNNGFNDYDIETLYKLQEQYNFDLTVKEFDVLSFLQSEEYIDYIHQYRCGSPHIVTHMKISELQPDGTVIFSGDPVFNKDRACFPRQNLLGLLHYAKLKRPNLVSHFFISTPELAWGLMCNDIKLSDSKYERFRKLGFDVIDPGNKYTGFEEIKKYYDNNYSEMVTEYDIKTRLPRQGSNRVFDLLLRNKYEYMVYKNLNTHVKFVRSNDA